MLAIVLTAAALRTHGVFANTLHADEALYASWARAIADGSNPLLHGLAVDKPPLLMLAQALAFATFGAHEWVARLVNWAAALLTVAVLARLGRAAADRPTGTLAALLFALSPFAVQFGPSAFTDPLLVLLCAAALLALLRQRPTASGALWGLALCAKYQALLWLPLLVWTAYCGPSAAHSGQRWLRGALLPLAALAVWLLLRGEAAAYATVGDAQLVLGLRPVFSWEWWPRLRSWSQLLQPFQGVAWPLVLLPAAAVVWQQATALWRGWLLWLAALAALYWLVATPIYDRYLLLLLPVALLEVARALRTLPAPAQATAVGALALALLWHAPAAYAGDLAIGATPRADGGAAQISHQLAGAPYGTVLYDHYASWQWRYHLYGSGVYVAWQPSPAALVADLNAFYDDRRYLVLPVDDRAQPFRQALAAAGYQTETLIQSGHAPGCGAHDQPPACQRLALYKIGR